VKLIAGAQGSVVRLKIGRAGEETQIEVTRGPVKVPTVKGFRRGADQRWDFMLDGKEKIGYAQVTMFGSATPEELRAALARMQQLEVKGLILDLRFCPGGSLEAAVNSAKLFLDSGTILSLHGREGMPKTIKADAADVLRGAPLVVLVSGYTASSGEVVAGALQDNKRAVVLGTRTVGKGSVQSLIQLMKGDGAIKLTTARYQLPSGRNIDKQAASKSWGIDPDEGYFVPVERAKMKALLTRAERDVIGGKGGEALSSGNAPVTAQWIEEAQGDPQLAAALKTMTVRLQTGTFAKVSSLSQAQIEQFLKREDIEQRRETVQENLASVIPSRSLRSPPAQKPRWPAPVSTTQRVEPGSAVSRVQRSSLSLPIWVLSALRTSGRLSVTRRMCSPRCSRRRVW
jgi:C-terminal peptidase prc